MRYQPDVRILELGEEFFDPVEAAKFPQCIPRFLNRRAAESVGLAGLSDAEWALHFCRFEPLAENLQQPLALRYHGHQFRVYNPDIGDGRGFLFAQLRGACGRLLDLGTKGSGQTPYSRTADGRLTLKGGVREVLATEMLEALGVNTSISLALFETGEALERGDEPSPTRSSVLTRLSHSHIRIGTFQRQAFLSDRDALDRLVRYCLEHLYDHSPAEDMSENALRLFDLVSQATATLAASYMAAGFVHGVLNSDNINITGESFDYGPWRFTPHWDAEFTAAYFDHYGLYAFARQPEAINWDLAQLGGCLSLLVPESAPLSEILASWGNRFEWALVDSIFWRLGVRRSGDHRDRALAAAVVRSLERSRVSIDRFYFDCFGGIVPASYGPEFEEVRQLLSSSTPRRPRNAYWSGPEPCSMHIEEVEAIWEAIAERDDWSPFHSKVAVIRRMGEAMKSDEG